MKVVLKLSGSKSKSSKHSRDFPQYGSASQDYPSSAESPHGDPEEFMVSFPLAWLRPVTPTALEEEGEWVELGEEPTLAPEQHHERKQHHHKVKKHKKHKKHSSVESLPSSLERPHPHYSDFDGGSSSEAGGHTPLISQAVPPSLSGKQHATTPLSGKQLSFSKMQSSPFKFTISKSISEESPLSGGGGGGVASFSSSSPALEGGGGDRKGHIHKHKKKHHHHHHRHHHEQDAPLTSPPFEPSPSELGIPRMSSSIAPKVSPGSDILGGHSLGGKHRGIFSSPEEVLGSEDTSHSYMRDSQDSMETSSSFQDYSSSADVLSHDSGSQSHDLSSSQSHDFTSGRPHKKKKDKKKKHKHSHGAPPPSHSPLVSHSTLPTGHSPLVSRTATPPSPLTPPTSYFPLVALTVPTPPPAPLPPVQESSVSRPSALKRAHSSVSSEDLPLAKKAHRDMPLATKSSTTPTSQLQSGGLREQQTVQDHPPPPPAITVSTAPHRPITPPKPAPPLPTGHMQGTFLLNQPYKWAWLMFHAPPSLPPSLPSLCSEAVQQCSQVLPQKPPPSHSKVRQNSLVGYGMSGWVCT